MKALRKLCSEQVRILLERMETHWEDEFALRDDTSKWEVMMPNGRGFKQFSRIERFCIRYTARIHDKALKKELAYRGIMERVMSKEKTRSGFEEEKYQAKKEFKPSKVLTAAAMTNQAQGILEDQLRMQYAQYRASGRYAMGYTDPLLMREGAL